MKPVLTKKLGWILLTVLLLVDAVLNIIRGFEGNPLWQPIIAKIGINATPILIPLALSIFYPLVKLCGWLVAKVDKTPAAEELVLTCLVIIYAIYDLWVVAVDFLNFSLITNFRLMIIPLIIVGLGYGLWAQKMLKDKQKTQ